MVSVPTASPVTLSRTQMRSGDMAHGAPSSHALRDALPWPRERFDGVLRALLTDYTVELHGGDPSVMTDEELRHSFTDADGTLYIALSWRGHL